MRKIISKFRCSDHKLEIEAGRHKKIDETERWCQVCRLEIESETHMLVKCPLYRNLRLKYFGPNVQADIAEIMKCETKLMAFNLANFLTKAYNLRDHCLRMRSYFNWFARVCEFLFFRVWCVIIYIDLIFYLFFLGYETSCNVFWL